MRRTGTTAGLLTALLLLAACSATPVATDAENLAGTSLHETDGPGIAGLVQGKRFALDRSMVTARRRMLGLAIDEHGGDPELINPKLGSWFLGLSFRYEEPGPGLTLPITNYGMPSDRAVAHAKLIRIDREGNRTEVSVRGGMLHVADWVERDGTVVELIVSVDLYTHSGGHVTGTFHAPVQGLYLAPSGSMP